MSEFGEEGCFNCSHGKLDIFLSTDLLKCTLHDAEFYVNSWCSEWNQMKKEEVKEDG